ncbi:MAG: META domain-containing protein [Candidatus Pedobacter colombiensis]|uniref:META domain-containing protein n=1 Tax=Candidatus Pedobacter colombiensis TaxID=3121371 RepID=A0AAJ5WA03_9SPHI|nr:META domain-containing protein [Pedobacter sp.]WEK19795.1 MAG: META domain-containing protein [Pedobacter sp.]
MKKILSVILITISALVACTSMKPNQAVQKLTGQWQLNYISGIKMTFDDLYPWAKPTLNFNAPFTEVSGNTSCNGFSTKLVVDGTKMTISQPGAMTMKHCEGDGEMKFMEMLKKVNAYNIDGNLLTLLHDGFPVMTFNKK